MKKWIPIILGSIGSFFILKSLFKVDQEKQKVIIVPVVKEERVERTIPVTEKATETPSPKLLNNAPAGTYLESGKVNLNSKR